MAARRGATPAQIVLRWHLQLGNIVIPRSTVPTRMRENFDAIHVAPLEPEEMAAFMGLEADGRTGPRPDEDPDEVDMRIDAVEARWNQIVRDAEGSRPGDGN
jgi:diketogulonate reductase-like aldo/keto reductase